MDRPKAPLVIELPYPYELGWTYEVTKVDPGGTAQIVAAGPSPESEWDKAEQGPQHRWGLTSGRRLVVREPWLFGGPCLMLVKPLVDGGEPRLFRVEVNVVGVMEWTVELGKAGAATVRPGDRCSLIRPLALTWDALRFLGGNRRDFQTFGRSEPTLTQDELRAFPRSSPSFLPRRKNPRPQSLCSRHEPWRTWPRSDGPIHRLDGRRPSSLVPTASLGIAGASCCCHTSGTGTCSTSMTSRSPGTAPRTCGCSTGCPPSSTTRSTATISATSRITRPSWAVRRARSSPVRYLRDRGLRLPSRRLRHRDSKTWLPSRPRGCR